MKVDLPVVVCAFISLYCIIDLVGIDEENIGPCF
jgi:hypothetical protein